MTGCKSPSPEQKADWIVKKVTSKLDLNNEQEAKLRAVKEAYLDSSVTLPGNALELKRMPRLRVFSISGKSVPVPCLSDCMG